MKFCNLPAQFHYDCQSVAINPKLWFTSTQCRFCVGKTIRAAVHTITSSIDCA